MSEVRILEAALNEADPEDASAAVNKCIHFDVIDRVIVDAAIDAGRVVTMIDHQNGIDDATKRATEALEKLAAFEADAERLHEMISEGRRDDAIALLGELTDQRFRTVAEQRNLFPDRVPA